MQSVIEHPGNDDEAWHSEQAQNSLPYEEAFLNVLPSLHLSPVERIAIYRRMFVLRMIDAMEIDYPGVKHALGDSFNDTVMDYVGKYPSNSYTLNHLGRRFPPFIRDSDLPQKEFLYDLSRLELALTENMDAPDSPLLSGETIARLQPEEWEKASLVPVTALTLMEFEYPAAEFLRAVVDDDSPAVPEEKEHNSVVVYRKQHATWFKQLSPEEYALLSSLCSGIPLVRSLELLVERFPGRQKELERNVFEWFGDWIHRGMFSSVTVPAPTNKM